MTETLLTTQELVVGYSGEPLLPPLNLTIPAAARVGIIGANGSGKSTLIKTLAGLIPPVQGSYQWKANVTFGYVPQEDAINPLFPLTVRDLLKMGMIKELSAFRRSSPSFERAAAAVLRMFGISELQHRLFRNLSRGQRQRSLIARALIADPTVLLLDEPYSTIDDRFRKELWSIFSSWQEKKNFSFFLIEHDLNRVINQVDWVIVLGPQELVYGKKSEVLTPEALGRAYGSEIHFHKDNGEIQVHFL